MQKLGWFSVTTFAVSLVYKDFVFGIFWYLDHNSLELDIRNEIS